MASMNSILAVLKNYSMFSCTNNMGSVFILLLTSMTIIVETYRMHSLEVEAYSVPQI